MSGGIGLGRVASQFFLQTSAGLVVSGTVFANTIYLEEIG